MSFLLSPKDLCIFPRDYLVHAVISYHANESWLGVPRYLEVCVLRLLVSRCMYVFYVYINLCVREKQTERC